MTREEVLSYFEEKYKKIDMVHIMEEVSKRSTDELIKIYKIELERVKNENLILENGTVTYTIDFDYNKKEEVNKFMIENNMFTIFDGKINYRCSSDGRLLEVPEKFITELQKHFDLDLSRKSYILGKKDLLNFNIGDKIQIKINDVFGLDVYQGTISEINDDSIKVKKYRSRNKFYKLLVGKELEISKLDKFDKNVF